MYKGSWCLASSPCQVTVACGWDCAQNSMLVVGQWNLSRKLKLQHTSCVACGRWPSNERTKSMFSISLFLPVFPITLFLQEPHSASNHFFKIPLGPSSKNADFLILVEIVFLSTWLNLIPVTFLWLCGKCMLQPYSLCLPGDKGQWTALSRNRIPNGDRHWHSMDSVFLQSHYFILQYFSFSCHILFLSRSSVGVVRPSWLCACLAWSQLHQATWPAPLTSLSWSFSDSRTSHMSRHRHM